MKLWAFPGCNANLNRLSTTLQSPATWVSIGIVHWHLAELKCLKSTYLEGLSPLRHQALGMMVDLWTEGALLLFCILLVSLYLQHALLHKD